MTKLKSRRRPRSDGKATRARLIDAGTELMAERGQQAVTLVDVAQRAGVSRGTAYHHFATRGALLAEVKASIQQELLKLAGGAHHFRNPFGLALRLAVEDESIIRTRIHRILEEGPMADPRTLNLLDALQEMADAGRLREGVDPRSAALIAAALDFAGVMALGMGRTVEARRELAARLSDTWHVAFQAGILRPDRSG
jgi:AcrR family transcriptional regulator